jgi:hypothetical protein
MSPWERGKKRNLHTAAVMDYFEEDSTKIYMICQVKLLPASAGSAADSAVVSKICGQQIKIAQTGEKDPGTRMGNLKKHLQRQHPDVYEVVQSQALTRTAYGKQQFQGQKKVDSFFAPKPEKVLVKHNMESFKAALVEMAVENAFSLRVFSTKGFKRLVGNLAEKLHVSLDKDQIRSYVILAANAEKDRLKEELRGKFVYLKFDCATRIRTNYLGLNVRYVNKDKLPTTATLKVVDTRSQHTAMELKDIIDKVLKDYEIPMEKVLCCVTDNASNMVKLVTTMNEDLKAAFGDQVQQDEEEDEDEYEDVEEDEDLQEAIPPSIEHMRCAAHTLQLAVYDGIKNSKGRVETKMFIFIFDN